MCIRDSIEACLNAVMELKIEHLFLQTNTIEFLDDKRLENIKGLTIQHELKNLTPLYNHPQLTHLSLPSIGINIITLAVTLLMDIFKPFPAYSPD